MILGFLVGQNVFYGSGCAGLDYLQYCSTGAAKTVEHSYAYRKCREKATKPSSASDLKVTSENHAIAHIADRR